MGREAHGQRPRLESGLAASNCTISGPHLTAAGSSPLICNVPAMSQGVAEGI